MIIALKIGLNDAIQATTSGTNKYPQRSCMINLLTPVDPVIFHQIVNYQGGLKCLLIDCRCLRQTFRITGKVSSNSSKEIMIADDDDDDDCGTKVP